MEEIVIDANEDDGERSPVWKLSIDEFERAAADPDHPLHEDAAAATLVVGQKINDALAPLVKSAYSGIEESLANIARHTLSAIDWDAPLRKLNVNLAPDVTRPFQAETLRVHEARTDIDIVAEVPEDTTMGDAVTTLVSKIDSVVEALQDRAAQADRHSRERREESSEASAIAEQALEASRVALQASKSTLTVSKWMLLASAIAAATGVGAVFIGLATLAATK